MGALAEGQLWPGSQQGRLRTATSKVLQGEQCPVQTLLDKGVGWGTCVNAMG
jgi:hypothetical protein